MRGVTAGREMTNRKTRAIHWRRVGPAAVGQRVTAIRLSYPSVRAAPAPLRSAAAARRRPGRTSLPVARDADGPSAKHQKLGNLREVEAGVSDHRAEDR